MRNRTLFATICATTGLALLLGAGSAAASPCVYAIGPATPIQFAPNPETGLIELTVPLTIGANAFTADLEVAILGFLEVGDDGYPRRAVVTHAWRIRENNLKLDWVGEAATVPTGEPNQIYYRLRLDLATSNGRYDAGTLFIEGIFNFDGTGDARSFFGKLCSRGNA
ncbi:MAG TPA: hypothetical protein VMT85_17470 [Thermoanaerobaculia bacterium]|nr:hypothetical protein [Thermoanaerobaculia bacterium]